MPSSAATRPLLLTYTWLAASSPTSTVASPGFDFMAAKSSATPLATRWRRPSAWALPSIRLASAMRLHPRTDGIRERRRLANHADRLVARRRALDHREGRFRQPPFRRQQSDHRGVGLSVL